MKTVTQVLTLLLCLAGVVSAQSIEFPYRGLDYSMTSKGGITVMVAPLSLSLLNYSAAHVWVTNGSKRTIRVEPQFFAARARPLKQPAAGDYQAVSDNVVVGQVMNRARLGDILTLVRAYERNLYGFKNDDAINYYQARKQMALAEGGSRKLRAAAMVSAIVLPKTDVPPGEFREGTVFFATGDTRSEFLGFTARMAGLQFDFSVPNAASQQSRD